MARTSYVAGIELGGTKAIAMVAEGPNILQRQVFPTTTPNETLGALKAQLKRWNEERPFEAVGIASFGPIRLDRDANDFGHMLATPKAGWTGADIIGSVLPPLRPLFAIDTDVNAAALAEREWGAGEESDSLCYITIGTGVGVGLVIGGHPIHGAMHPEMGHILPRRKKGDTFAGICPFHGDCIEGLVSGPALEARFGKPGAEIDNADPLWTDVAGDVAQMIANILLTTAAQRVLIGGGVGMGRPHLLPLIRSRVVTTLGGYLPHVNDGTIDDIVKLPGLGADAGPLGAIALALKALNA